MIYENNKAFPFGAFVTNLGKYNEGHLAGEWVKFPATRERMDEVMAKIGIGQKRPDGSVYEEVFITDYDCNISSLTKYLHEYSNINELNYLAEKIDEIDDFDRNKFNAVIESGEGIKSIADIINLTDNLDNYNLINAGSDEELGIYLISNEDKKVPDWLDGYIDYEAYGRDYAINGGAISTSEGYVYSINYDTEYYKGIDDIPKDSLVTGFNEEETEEMELDVPEAAPRM